jgi:hypothetical protein
MFGSDVGKAHSTLVVTGSSQLTLVRNNTAGGFAPVGPSCTFIYTVSGRVCMCVYVYICVQR